MPLFYYPTKTLVTMKKIHLLFFAAIAILSAFTYKPTTIYDFTVKDILGNEVSLSKYKGKVLLIVNVASKCGLTPQYADLQALYDEYAEKGLEILGFPANDFNGQEPGTEDEIQRFCTEKYGVTFPMFSKISVKGEGIHPLYEYLTSKTKNKMLDAPVEWNFQKFLIDTKGKIVQSFTPRTKVTEEGVRAVIESLLSLDKKGKNKQKNDE